GRSVLLEEMLDGPRGDVVALLTHKERPLDLVADELAYLVERLFVDENSPYFVSFTLYPYRLLLEVDILDTYRTEFRNTDARGVNEADDQPIALALDSVEQADDLAVFEVF